MIRIRIADLTAELANRYGFVENQCRDYLADPADQTDLYAKTSEEQIEKERSFGMGTEDPGYAESICLYRAIADELYAFDAFLMHGAVIGFEGKAYAFLAPSGTGKSTHIRLWRRHLRDGVIPVNGDKPILRFDAKGTLTAYGTPWAGKEGWQRNVGLPLGGICLLTRGQTNAAIRLAPGEAVATLLRQIYLPAKPEAALTTMALVDRMVAQTPIYRLTCNMEEGAVAASFEALTGMDYLQAKGTYA